MEHKCLQISYLWRGQGESIMTIYWLKGTWWAGNNICASEVYYCPWCGVALNALLNKEVQYG